MGEDLAKMNIGTEVVAFVPIEIAKKYGIIPYKLEENTLYLATHIASNLKLNLTFKELLGNNVYINITSSTNIVEAMAKYYKLIYQATNDDDVSIEDMSEEQSSKDKNKGISPEEETDFARRINKMFDLAIENGTTDIHIIPNDKKVSVSFKIAGQLVDFSESLNKSLLENNNNRFINKIKAMCTPALTGTAQMPVSGAISYSNTKSKVDCRVSLIPTIRGESIVIRLLDEKKEFKTLNDVGYSEDTIKKIRKVLVRPGGLVLVTGPVNSGKSTSLYACLNEYNFKKEAIITIEDPVEQKNENLIQVQIKKANDEKHNLTFAKVLREVLRHDPNKILIGEIRDKETAEIAIQASLTGHEVLSTLHNKNVISTIDRLLNMGIDKRMLLSELSIVISQRLISTLCPMCCEGYVPTDADLFLLDENEVLQLKGKTLKKEGEHRHACTNCNGTGYSGLQVVEECLPITNEIRDFLLEKHSLKELGELLKKYNFISMQDKALNLVLEGKTSIQKYLATLPDNN